MRNFAKIFYLNSQTFSRKWILRKGFREHFLSSQIFSRNLAFYAKMNLAKELCEKSMQNFGKNYRNSKQDFSQNFSYFCEKYEFFAKLLHGDVYSNNSKLKKICMLQKKAVRAVTNKNIARIQIQFFIS